MIFDQIFASLEQLGIPELVRAGTDSAKSTSFGFMDLHFDRLYETENGVVISLAHYFEQNGDLCCDPDMEIRVDLERQTAEALTFQMAVPPVYQQVYSDCGKANAALSKALYQFLADWLRNCVAQGRRFGAARKRRLFR